MARPKNPNKPPSDTMIRVRGTTKHLLRSLKRGSEPDDDIINRIAKFYIMQKNDVAPQGVIEELQDQLASKDLAYARLLKLHDEQKAMLQRTPSLEQWR
jgi:hypothetical protein